jgi:hypothetical protein
MLLLSSFFESSNHVSAQILVISFFVNIIGLDKSVPQMVLLRVATVHGRFILLELPSPLDILFFYQFKVLVLCFWGYCVQVMTGVLSKAGSLWSKLLDFPLLCVTSTY